MATLEVKHDFMGLDKFTGPIPIIDRQSYEDGSCTSSMINF